ncbi:scp-like extracellular [Colletotrichum truncatum]|uniref:Scp-like extracellular n=1 Tax=Colletotrichum truncatum TaxID=5467 RepID=A0ACC3YU31_COLTU
MHFSLTATTSVFLLATNVASQNWLLPLVTSTKTEGNAPTTLITSTATKTTTIRLFNYTISSNTTSTLNSTLTSSTLFTSTTSTPAASTSSNPNPGLTADQQKALDLHNEARKLVGVPPLKWDADLAVSAQAYAIKLTAVGKLEHDTNRGEQGENLYYQWGSPNPPYESATTWWLNEKPYYTNQPIPQDSSNGKVFADYGHYTQAVWRSTEKVGLAIANALDGKTYVVARYFPSGNV